MIQVCDPPRQRQVRRLSAEEFFTLVRCGGAGFYRPCSEVLRMLIAGLLIVPVVALPGAWAVAGFVEPGESLGLAFDGLIFVNGRWVLMPKPWRVLE